MREQLIRYVELLFAGAENAGDIQQEILQNTLDRYDDLIAQGKTPEAAYRLAISGIGDINEILGSAGGAAPKATGAVPQPVQKGVVDAKWQPLLRVLSIVCYILCPLPLFLIQDEVGLCLLLVMVALGVALGMLAGPGKGNSESETTGKEVSAPRQAVRSLIGITGLAFYLAVSFATRAWWLTWLVFPLTGCVSGLVMAVWDLCVQKGGVASGVVRIVIFTLLALALVAVLVFSVGFSSTSGPISDLFCIWNTSQADGIPSPSGSVSAEEVSRLAIHWVAGSVRVEPSENATDISFRLIGEDDAKFPMVWSQSGDTLILSPHPSERHVLKQKTDTPDTEKRHRGCIFRKYQNSPASYITADRAHSGAVSQRRMRLPRVQTAKPIFRASATSCSSKPPSGPVSRLTDL